jgi:hypothetical protein
MDVGFLKIIFKLNKFNFLEKVDSFWRGRMLYNQTGKEVEKYI